MVVKKIVKFIKKEKHIIKLIIGNDDFYHYTMLMSKNLQFKD